LNEDRAEGGGLVLIMEDDVLFNQNVLKQKYIQTLGQHILHQDRNNLVDMFCLGHIAFGGGHPSVLLGEGLIVMRVRSVLTHAYILTHNGMHRFLKYGTFGADGQFAVDQWFRCQMKQEAIFPQFATQSGSPSGINGDTTQSNNLDKSFVFYTRFHVLLDVLFCWVVPFVRIALPVMTLATAFAIVLRSLRIFVLCLIFTVLFLVLGVVLLGTCAFRVQRHSSSPSTKS
jgi:GR25 family glycosyltransferase involved in LPS biosynthesis